MSSNKKHHLEVTTSLRVYLTGTEDALKLVTPLGLLADLVINRLVSVGTEQFVEKVSGLVNVTLYRTDHNLVVVDMAEELPVFIEVVQHSIVEYANALELCFQAMVDSQHISDVTEYLPELNEEFCLNVTEHIALVICLSAKCDKYTSLGVVNLGDEVQNFKFDFTPTYAPNYFDVINQHLLIVNEEDIKNVVDFSDNCMVSKDGLVITIKELSLYSAQLPVDDIISRGTVITDCGRYTDSGK
jgi:hypothetical protein